MMIVYQLVVDFRVTKPQVVGGAARWRAGESHQRSSMHGCCINAARARVRPPLLAHKLLRFRRVSGSGRLVTL